MADTIYIDDLANPRLTEAQRAAIDYGETLRVDLGRDAILRDAMEITGLNDWGPVDFVERLDLLCDEWGNDEGLLGIGRLTLRNKLLQFASNRLLLQDMFNRHPEIDDISIEAPLIVAGLPRSGTTHLVNLIARDTRFRSLPLWESYEPVPSPGEGMLADGTDPRYRRCAEAWESMRQFTPHIAAMHPMNPDHIHEELELMGPNFGSYNMEWLASMSPRWRDHYYNEDQTYQYDYMKRVLKLLLWQQRGSDRPTRWVLKCPQHLEQLPVLHRVFPDATIAITHRDPVSAIQSAVTMLAYGDRMRRKQVRLDELLAYWTDRIEHLLRACVRDRGSLAGDRSIDVPFHEFIEDDVGWVEKIYDKAGLELDDAARARFEAFVRANSESYGRVVYDLKNQFNADPRTLRERFAFYYETFSVQRAEE